MSPAGWIVRFDGTPTTGARIAAAVLLLCGFLGGFAARSRGEDARPRPAAAGLSSQLAGDTPAAVPGAAAPRLAPVALLPGLRAAPVRRRSRPVAKAVPVATPQPAAAPVAEPTPAPQAVPLPVAAPPAPALAPPPAPAPAPAPKPRRPPAPDLRFDSSG